MERPSENLADKEGRGGSRSPLGPGSLHLPDELLHVADIRVNSTGQQGDVARESLGGGVRRGKTGVFEVRRATQEVGLVEEIAYVRVLLREGVV